MDSSNDLHVPAREAADQVRCSSHQLQVPILLTSHTSGTKTSTTTPVPLHSTHSVLLRDSHYNQDTSGTKTPNKSGKSKNPGSKLKTNPVKWVDLFTCFGCGKEGRSPPLRRCSQCEIAYYCSKTCQRGHWKKHKANARSLLLKRGTRRLYNL